MPDSVRHLHNRDNQPPAAPVTANVGIAAAYGAAWAAHDVDAIIALHTPDMVMESVMTGDVLGGEDLRAFLEGYFSTWPDIAFRERRVHHTPHLLVNEWTAIATHVKEIRRDGKLAPPTGRVVEWNGVDVMPLENGLVKRKIVYADSLGFLRQIGLA